MSSTVVIRGRRSVQVPPSIGMTVMNSLLVMVSVRHDPLRITGISRHDLSTAAASHDAHDKVLQKAMRRGRRTLRQPRATSVTVALQPQEDRIVMSFGETPAEPVAARCRPTLPRLLSAAGFGSVSYDLLPAALLRAARSTSRSSGSFHHRSGWRVDATSERLEARWSGDNAGDSNAQEAMVLGDIHVPLKLQAILRVDLDAGAIGAALGGVGVGPHTCRLTHHELVDLRRAERPRPDADSLGAALLEARVMTSTGADELARHRTTS